MLQTDHKISKLNRRELLKIEAMAGASALLIRQVQAVGEIAFTPLAEKLKELTGTGQYTSQSEWVPPPDTKHKFAMVIDLGLCIG